MGGVSSAGRANSASLPLCIVHGNCQAPALSEVLRSSPAFATEYDIVRVPGVHTITAGELSELKELIARASLIVAQPVIRGIATWGSARTN